MNAAFKACLLALLLLLVLPSSAHADNLPAPMIDDSRINFLTTVQGDKIILKYNPGTVSDIPGIVATANAVQEKIDRLFDGYPYRTTMVIAGANNEFRLFINVGDAPDTMKALNWNVGYNGLIVTKSPGLLSDFEQVFGHQMARIAVRTRQTIYKSLPEWYQDGVAAYVAGDLTQAQRATVTVKAVTGGWKSLDDIERAYKNMTIYNYDEQEYRDARAQAAALVDDIGTRFGGRTLVGIIDDYTVSGNLTQAFVNRTTFTPDALNDDFKSSLAGNPGATPTPPAGGTATAKPGIVTSPTARPTGHGGQNTTGALPAEAAGTFSMLSGDDTLLYGFIAAVNAAGLIAVLLILRRNWH